MLCVAKGSTQTPYTGAQIIERGLIAGVPPKQGGQFAAMLATIRAEREIGQQQPLAVSQRGQSLAVGKRLQVETAEQPKRPARVPAACVAHSCPRGGNCVKFTGPSRRFGSLICRNFFKP